MASEQPNVLFLLSDQHSFRFMGHRDDGTGEPVRTPAFDRIAASGTVFRQAYCQVPLCTPSRITLLTGREARNCGAWSNGHMIEGGQTTVAEAFSAAGYETCLAGKMHLGGDRQFVGFDHRPYGDLTGSAGHQLDPLDRERNRHARLTDVGVTDIPESHLQEENTARETLAFVREQAASDAEAPWFACASFSRPHDPYTAPERHVNRYWPEGVTEPRVRHEGDTADHPLVEAARERQGTTRATDAELMEARAAYFACVDFIDEVVGDLIARLERDGLLENTIVVYTSDHGEMAGEHGVNGKRTWHESSTRVPWLVETPDQRAGDRPGHGVETPVSLLDLFPTLCGLADVDAPDGLDGVDLSRAVETGEEPERGPVFVDYLLDAERVHVPGVEYRMVRDGRYKYVGFRDAPELLFDLERDRAETRNLAPDAEGADAAALDRLRALQDRTMDFEAARRERIEDERRHGCKPWDLLDAPEPASGNAYLLPDGRIVDADTLLYEPTVIIERPEETYDDWPGERT